MEGDPRAGSGDGLGQGSTGRSQESLHWAGQNPGDLHHSWHCSMSPVRARQGLVKGGGLQVSRQKSELKTCS